MLVIANANQLRFNLQEMRLMPATLPLAVNFAHFRWQHPGQRMIQGYETSKRGTCNRCVGVRRHLSDRYECSDRVGR
jgi:hypothetical protein